MTLTRSVMHPLQPRYTKMASSILMMSRSASRFTVRRAPRSETAHAVGGLMLESKRIVLGLALGSAVSLGLAGAALAQTPGTLGWSYAEVGVGSCNRDGGCTAAHPPVYITRPNTSGYDRNSSISRTDST